jgi:hypothetical protein
MRPETPPEKPVIRRRPRHAKPRPGRLRVVAGTVALGVLLGASGAAAGLSPATPPAPAAAVDSSAVTVTAASQDADIANSPTPDLKVTVSQTRDLQAQGIEVSWTGGAKSEVPTSQTGGKDFLQIMQCWGDDPDHPGEPDRRTCQYGALLTPGSLRDSNVTAASIADEDQQFTDPGTGGFFDPPYTSVPFLSKTGELIASVDENREHVKVDVNTNKFFTAQTTNEIAWAGSSSEGTGLAKFEVQTAAQSPGLGCGTPVEARDGSVSGTSCWLVVLPRGQHDPGEQNITTSGLFYDTWKHRVAVKLDFRPIGVRCAIGAAEQQLAGSELVSDAIASWQPALCGKAGGSAYTNIIGSEADAALAANGTAAAPLALTSRALSVDDVPDKLAYAPIALTAISIAFAIDAEPDAIKQVPQEVADRARQPFTEMKLTPRLLAKLLTNSYLDSLPTGADKSHLGFVSSTDPGHNARNLTSDPDFIELNGGDWQYQSIAAASLADVLVPQGRSDAAWAIWQYVQADADAAAFLAGTADPWGMVVNPYSSTDASLNPNGVPFSIPRADFPKADPAEQPQDSTGVGAVNVVTWRPYTNDFNASAYDVLRGDGLILGAWDPNSIPPKFGKTARALPGLQRVIGVTDAAAAAKYQVFSAALMNPAGDFVTPTADSMQAAAAAMTTTGEQTQVYGFDPATATAKGATTAYPLTLPVYAAVNPAMADPEKRSAYAAFIEYAAGAGQESGTDLGQLPEGYAPMPEGWRSQALSAAAVIRAGGFATPAPTTSTGSGSGSSSTSGSLPPASQSVAQAAPPAASSSVGSATAPSASGDVAGALTGAKTPVDPDIGVLSAIVPLAILGGLALVVAVPLLFRALGRRRTTVP